MSFQKPYIPEEYIIQKFYQFSGNPTYNKFTNVYNGSCPICREGKSWGRKRRLFFIPKDNISQWYSVRQEDNLLLGVAGAAGGTYTGAFVGIEVCGASAGILCIPALLGGVYGGGRLGSQVGKGKNFLFSVIGQNSEGSTVAQNFRMLKRKTSKKLKKDLSEITGLKMGQVKIVGK